MPYARIVVTAAAVAVTLGVFGDGGLHPEDLLAPDRSDILIVQNDAPKAEEKKVQDSAKMGKEEGTHAGASGSKSENDTNKIDQPARSNPTTDDNSAKPSGGQ